MKKYWHSIILFVLLGLYSFFYFIKTEIGNSILIFSFLVIFLIFIIFFNFEEIKEVKFFGYINSKKSFFLFLIKITILFLLLFLWQYFLSLQKIRLATTSYLFAFIQTLLLISPKKHFLIEKERENNVIKKKTEIKFLVFLLTLAYLAYFFAIKENGPLFLLFFIFLMWFLKIIRNIIITPYLQYSNHKKFFKIDFFILIAILIMAFFIRIYKLLYYPPGVSYDQLMWRQLYSLLQSGHKVPIYLNIPYYHSTLHVKFFMFLSNLLKFKINIFTVNYFHAVIGVINVLFIVLISYELFSRRVAIIAGIIITFMMEHLLFSRNGGPMILTMTAASASFYFYFVGLRKNNIFLMLLSGIFLGLGIYFYTPGRAAPFVYIFYWIGLLLFIKDKKVLIYDLRMSLIMVISSFIVFAPLGLFVIKNPNIYFSRINEVNILKAWEHSPNIIHSIISQMYNCFNHLFGKSGWWGTYNLPSQPTFDAITQNLFIIGLATIFINIKRRNYFFILIWFITGMLVGFFATQITWNTARFILSLTVLPIITAIGLDTILWMIENLFLTKKTIKKVLVFGTVTIILIVISILNYKMFFIIYPKDPSVKYIHVSKYNLLINEIKKYKNINIIASDYFNSSREGYSLYYWLDAINKKAKYINMRELNPSIFYNKEGKDILFIAESIYYKNLFYLKKYFPDMKIYRIWNYDYFIWRRENNSYKYYKEVLHWKEPKPILERMRNFFYYHRPFENRVPYCFFVIAHIPYSNIEKLFLINIIGYKENNGKIIKENKKIKTTSIPVNGYKKIKLSNLITFPEYGKYNFYIGNSKKYKIFIDNELYNKNKKYYKGLHKVKIIIYSENNNIINIKWSTPLDNQQKFIPIKYFINSNKIYGLVAKYFSDEKKVCYKELNSLLQFHTIFEKIHLEKVKKCNCKQNVCLMQWTGNLYVDTDGNYFIFLHTLWESKVLVDGKLTAEKERYKEPKLYKIYLKKGKHKIKIITKNYFADNVIRLLWKKEGENIFYDVLPDRLRLY